MSFHSTAAQIALPLHRQLFCSHSCNHPQPVAPNTNHCTRYPSYNLCSPHTTYGSLCRNSQGVFLPQLANNQIYELTSPGKATTTLLILHIGRCQVPSSSFPVRPCTRQDLGYGLSCQNFPSFLQDCFHFVHRSGLCLQDCLL